MHAATPVDIMTRSFASLRMTGLPFVVIPSGAKDLFIPAALHSSE
jgi:hypothetical protein